MKQNKGFYAKYIKRPLDFLCALIALIILSPLMVIVGILVKIKLGSPVIFKQKRPGLDGEIFELYKFRSMSNQCDKNGNLLSDQNRLTRFGKSLRAASLDELPELVNILKGNMSIVGPRPLAVEYLEYYTKEEKHRHDVRPGLTGLAQINGRNGISWEKRFEYDVSYVNSISFWGDIKIILQTVMKVIKHEGIVQGETGPKSLHIERANKDELET